MKPDKNLALYETTKVLDFIMNDNLTVQEKDMIVKDSMDNFNEHVNPGWLKYRKSVSTNEAFVEWEDSSETFRDLYGNEFIDCLGGFGIYTCGHRNPQILKYVQKQLDRYALHSQELIDPLRGYLAKALALCTPGDLKYAFFCNGGAEAVEMALKLARLVSGKKYYISTVNAFHGKSLGAVSVAGKDTYREPYGPMIQQVQHVEYGNADAAEAAIKNLIAVGETVAAMIVEPIQGEAGIIIPPVGYLTRLREICDKYEVLLIFDEIQTGMGRTGKLWAAEHENVVPDIMTYGKAFGGGIMPITGIIAREKLWTEKIIENPWILGSPTFGGNPVCCSAALATLKFMLETNLPQQIAEKGDYIMSKLKEYEEKYSILEEVRGKGLLIGLEFKTSEMGYEVSKSLFEKKVMTAGTLVNAKTLRIEPPGTISYETLDVIVERFGEALAEVDEMFMDNEIAQ